MQKRSVPSAPCCIASTLHASHAMNVKYTCPDAQSRYCLRQQVCAVEVLSQSKMTQHDALGRSFFGQLHRPGSTCTTICLLAFYFLAARPGTRGVNAPVILGLQGSVQAPGLVLAGLGGEGQAGPEVAQQLIAGQGHAPALLLQGLCQVCHWGYAHQAALLVQGDCGVLSM